jgi:hypothetical protein
MLQHAKLIIEREKIAINPRLDKLITSLRIAIEQGKGSLDEESTSYLDIMDSFRLSLKNYKFRSSLKQLYSPTLQINPMLRKD